MRFPCARDTDPDAYRIRLEYLAADTAHLAVPLLRKACARVSQSARGLPYASEIIQTAAAIVNERADAERNERRGGGPISADPRADALAARAREYNVANAEKGVPHRWTAGMEVFLLGTEGERRGARNDGSIIEPWFHHKADDGDRIPQGWHCKQEDARQLQRCFDEHGRLFTLQGCMIVERAA